MSDRFYPVSLGPLARLLKEDYEARREMLGIPKALFWDPSEPLLHSGIFGKKLETPLGVAAGPHTQLAGNIVASWLVGARFIELKTIQTLDELDVAKPCIDAEDLTFNCEWSQELRLDESLDEYTKAWVLLHTLRKKLWGNLDPAAPGFVFNMSVGYDLDGILKPNVTRFLEGMADASTRIRELQEELAEIFPEAAQVEIPSTLSDNVTLSTMHGCPPEEIEQIAHHLLTKRKVHTTVKMNPTLLGPDLLRALLNQQAGFSEVDVPHAAFEHDTKYEDAVAMIRRLRDTAQKEGLAFGLKLTNTLEVRNHRPVFPEGQDMMYMSGRALHPLSVAIAKRLTDELGHTVPISFAGGADAFNIVDILASGLSPVTVCTDLLKSGGYMRLRDYFENTLHAMRASGVTSLGDLALAQAAAQPSFSTEFQGVLAHESEARGLSAPDKAPTELPSQKLEQARESLTQALDSRSEDEPLSKALRSWRATVNDPGVVGAFEAAARRLSLQGYARELLSRKGATARAVPMDTKSDKPLGWFDCVEAPCAARCPARQGVPQYMRLVEAGRFSEAHAVVKETNALSRTTGAVCDHPCTTKCVRNHYDEALAIREIKRAAAAYGEEPNPKKPAGAFPQNSPKVALIGAGPASLSAAYTLARGGAKATVFESREQAGGMAASVIPRFRLPDRDLTLDIQAVEALGVDVRYGKQAGQDFTLDTLRKEGFDRFFVAVGAQNGRRMGIEGEDAEGVLDGLTFLSLVKRDEAPPLGDHVLVVGGGNSAMDAARTAWRVATPEAKVTVLYRRSRAQMPADPEEVEALLEEGVEILELENPVTVIKRGHRVSAVECVKMKLGPPDKSGRPRPVPVEGSQHALPCTALIVSVGQSTILDFLLSATDTAGGDASDRSGEPETKGPRFRRGGTLWAHPETQETTVEGLYAGGDAVRGPATVIQAVADGRRAALDILKKAGAPSPTPLVASAPSAAGEEISKDKAALILKRAKRLYQASFHELPLPARHGFQEVTPVLSREKARQEAARCLSCDEVCDLCVTVCPNRANRAYATPALEATLPTYRLQGGAMKKVGESHNQVSQATQIVNIDDLCNECGNCRTFCPTGGAPYLDKPRWHLDASSYEAETDKAFHVDRDGENLRLRLKAPNGEHALISRSDTLLYKGPEIEAKLSPDSFEVGEVLPGSSSEEGDEVNLDTAFQMAVLLLGLQRTYQSLLPVK